MARPDIAPRAKRCSISKCSETVAHALQSRTPRGLDPERCTASECRRTVWSRPSASRVAIIEVPPAETKGNGIPVMGMT